MSVATENPVANLVPMRPGKNGGQLRTGGSNPKAGRRANRIKRAAARDLAAVQGHLVHWANGVAVEFVEDGKTRLISPTVAERKAAVELLHKISGIGDHKKIEIGDIAQRLQRQVGVILSRDSWNSIELTEVLSELWR